MIEHPSILNVFQYLEKEGWNVTYLPVNKYGVIEMQYLEDVLTPETVLISIMHVNNEIGSIQPIERIGKLIREKAPNAVFHVDAVQSFGKLDIHPEEWEIDLLSISGHKIHAPKGIGALYIRKGILIMPLQWGGGQEKGIRSGTENLPGIVGLGEAVKWIKGKIKSEHDYLYKLKRILVSGISEQVPEAVVNGPKPEEGAPHILNISIPGVRGEVLLHVLESKGVYVSTGSACSSRRAKISHVLEAIGTSKDMAEGAIRLSLSYLNNEDEMRQVPGILRKSIDEVKRFTRR
jgi:cysteine desulfurase